MQKDVEVQLGPGDHKRLEAVAGDRDSPPKHVWRAQIVPASSEVKRLFVERAILGRRHLVGGVGERAARSPRRTGRATRPVRGAIIRLVGAVLLEVNHEWQLQHRYMQAEAMAERSPPMIDAMPTQIPTVAA